MSISKGERFAENFAKNQVHHESQMHCQQNSLLAGRRQYALGLAHRQSKHLSVACCNLEAAEGAALARADIESGRETRPSQPAKLSVVRAVSLPRLSGNAARWSHHCKSSSTKSCRCMSELDISHRLLQKASSSLQHK